MRTPSASIVPLATVLSLAIAPSAFAAAPPNARARTKAALARVAQLDNHGPALHALIEVNPDALSLADALDAHKPAGPISPWYGEPIVVKDNLETGDKMLTTAGSFALAGTPAARDATVVAKLRAAGFVLLGKSNLSEWANWRSTHSTSGWSARGGQTRNPYALARNPCGSSSGSAVAVAAGYTRVAIGTETDGSIVCPAAMNGIVGIKPTVGLVSRAGVIPISHTQDTPGPMAVDMASAAALLSIISGSDPRDPATAEADKHVVDYSKSLDSKALQGARIGVVRKLAGFDPAVDRILDAAIATMKGAGATVLEVEIPHLSELGAEEDVVLNYEFKADLDAYLAARSGISVHTLADIIEFNSHEAARELPLFGQELFEKSQAKGPLTDAVYIAALAKAHRLAGPEGIDAALAKDHLDALLAPTTGAAFLTDWINGDSVAGGSSQPAAVAGYPDITIPAGAIQGLPVGISLFGAKWSEPRLIALGFAFEQLTRVRKPPTFPVDVVQMLNARRAR